MSLMKTGDKVAMCLGTLDVVNVAWAAMAAAIGKQGLASIAHNARSFGFPHPDLLVTGVVIVYLAIAACGIDLVLRRHRVVWLNYLLLPVRIALFIPTLYPVLAILSALNIVAPPSVVIAALVLTELGRCTFIYSWQRRWRHHAGTNVSAQAI